MKIIRVVDLSHPINEQTQVYPGDPVPKIVQHSTIARDGFNLMSIEMGSQSGTHVDAPFHFDDATARIDELDLKLFVGEALVVDCGPLEARQCITWELVSSQIPEADVPQIVIFKTLWSRHYGTDSYFENPFLDADLVSRLLAAGVRSFGLDAINIDETPDENHPGVGFPAHHLIAEAGGVICENLTNLEAITFARPVISLLPMKFVGIDGAPVRAVAMEVE